MVCPAASSHSGNTWSFLKNAESLRQERDAPIRSAYEDGLPMVAIARIVGMSHQRVSQIIRS
jgi:DNA-directed RNA polymerase specialized sigma subunit